jgi:hypothetical protein
MDAEAIPFPREDTTPPVTKICLVAFFIEIKLRGKRFFVKKRRKRREGGREKLVSSRE